MARKKFRRRDPIRTLSYSHYVPLAHNVPLSPLEARQVLDLTQVQMALLTDMSERHWIRLENGKVQPTIQLSYFLAYTVAMQNYNFQMAFNYHLRRIKEIGIVGVRKTGTRKMRRERRQKIPNDYSDENRYLGDLI